VEFLEVTYIRDLKLNYCVGCLSCLKTGRCFQQDDANTVLPKMMEADVVYFASPVYYYSVSGQMKVFIDRMNPLYNRMQSKEFYYMVTAAEDDKRQLDRAMDALQGFADCFKQIEVKGRIYGGGAEKKGDITYLPAYQEAYELGRQV